MDAVECPVCARVTPLMRTLKLWSLGPAKFNWRNPFQREPERMQVGELAQCFHCMSPLAVLNSGKVMARAPSRSPSVPRATGGDRDGRGVGVYADQDTLDGL